MAVIIETDWNGFKGYVNSSGLSIQMIEHSDCYEMYVPNDVLLFKHLMIKNADPNKTADQIEFEENFKPSVNKPIYAQQSPFASKVLSNGKKFYKREHGIREVLVIGTKSIIFPITYNWVKLMAVEILHATDGDYADLSVLDSTTGTYSGTANLVLNKFGYEYNIAANYHRIESSFDCDLYVGMQIKLAYTSVAIKNIGINFDFSEIK